MAVFNVDKSHNNAKLTCDRGDRIILELPENPTTGFKWHIIDSEGLTVKDDQFKLDKQVEKNTMGAGGTRSLTFELKGPQRASLHLEYYQEWEGIESSSDSFRLSMNLKS